ncbi:hypothetical protein ACIQC9_03810 [Brevundimonas sp. NPDC092305]|uniref:hypothetical protein n=1 Tax=Brevundimonas sp. NPDC092305 TaxID=3363957 RepID=UPI00380C25BE
MNLVFSLAALALLAGAPQDPVPAAPPVPASPAPDPETATEIDDVVVYGGDPVDRAQRFVQEVSRPAFSRPLARWNDPLCVGVTNIEPVAAQAMIDRISTVAVALGLETEPPGCKPNVLVIAGNTDQLATLARNSVRDRPMAWRPSRGGTDLGSVALREFANSTAPVRWWHVSLPRTLDEGIPAIPLNGEPPPQLVVRGASRISSQLRTDLMGVVILADLSKMQTTSFAALADYIAMVALAQIDPALDVHSADTILNLFNPDQAAPRGMTEWDAAFLVSLYESKPNPLSPSQQQRELSREIVRLTGQGG